MTRGELVESIAINHRLTKRMSAAIVDVVVTEVLAHVEPFALNQWGGAELLRKLRAFTQNTVATQLHLGRKHG